MGEQKADKMWLFKNKSGDKDVCLIPEVTAIIQEAWNSGWNVTKKKPYRIFYVSRCYRYDRPQKGRYREFTQFGVEVLGPTSEEIINETKDILRKCLDSLDIEYNFVDEVVRGIGYYTENGFEAECQNLGAQKQIAGGGVYTEGVGWAIGVDRVVISKMEKER